MSGREKTIASFHTKAIVKQYNDPWAQITDKSGVRAIVERARHVDDLTCALKDWPGLEILRVEDKRQVMDPEQLSYSGVHLQVAVPAELDDEEPIECEIQLRTVTQDAWSVISHRLLYKPPIDLPREHKRRLYRLVALVELFDEEVQRVEDAIPEIPGYEVADLIEAAEKEFIPLAHAASSREFSSYILGSIHQLIPAKDRAVYSQVLGDFVEQNLEKLRAIYRDYGPRSSMADAPEYTLFSQAESLIIFQILTKRPHGLFTAWVEGELPLYLLEPLLILFDVNIDPME
ncbi:hypothetical protein [Actinomadura sp. WMMA1423]|uniref:hypothetical protein n=1 Tax=Actinomadura sp. WMMA1423 TaxID=2591108 RepID=UPI00143D103C|nr:hypothetical protein [Actinomadura sp. WMMA1423]